jgi:hypothetical protein
MVNSAMVTEPSGEEPWDDPGVSSFRIHFSLSVKGTIMNAPSVVVSAVLFCLCLIPMGLTAQEPAGRKSAAKAPASAAGRATREIDEWSASFTSQTHKVEELQKRIEQDVPRAMDAASTNIERALTDFLKDPSNDNRLGLQKITEDELQQFVESLKPIVGQRKVLETAIADLEKRLHDRAAGHQVDEVKLNSQLSVLKSAFAKSQGENKEFKKKLAAKPADANLNRELRKRFRDEQRQQGTLLTVERKIQFSTMAAKAMDKKAQDIADLGEETEATLDNLETTANLARDSAEMLTNMRVHDLEIDAVGGKRLSATLDAFKVIRANSGRIGGVIKDSITVLQSDEGGPPATPRVADEDYIRWTQDH